MKIIALAAALAIIGGPVSAGQSSIKIGILNDQNGPFADLGGPGTVLAARMAVQDFGNSVLGRPIEVVTADTQNKPDNAASIAARWIDVQAVDVIAGVPVTSVALAVKNVTERKGRILLATEPASTEITSDCPKYTVHWMDNTDALASGTVAAVVKDGGKKWFFLTADFAFGATMESAARKKIAELGAQVVGEVRYPVGTFDFASFLLVAANSPADVVGVTSVGADTANAVRQAAEFGLSSYGKKVIVFLTFLTEINAIGLDHAQGAYVTTGLYWDENDATRSWSKRYFAKMSKMPTQAQMNTYAAIMHYLNSVKQVGSDDPLKVMGAMRASPADYFGKRASVRKDGRVLYDLQLFRIKAPRESKYPWDYLRPVRTINADEAFGDGPPGCRE
ncbi:ABC transporter substrate-binding protein [Bradyrhizobium sp. STM 3566]|uniref:ABC transporter substrate-binding protein n=1 Tax=Bradyrhizobium sp. STM 3566 TaxID=578928 RepID=UPI003890B6A5